MQPFAPLSSAAESRRERVRKRAVCAALLSLHFVVLPVTSPYEAAFRPLQHSKVGDDDPKMFSNISAWCSSHFLYVFWQPPPIVAYIRIVLPSEVSTDPVWDARGDGHPPTPLSPLASPFPHKRSSIIIPFPGFPLPVTTFHLLLTTCRSQLATHDSRQTADHSPRHVWGWGYVSPWARRGAWWAGGGGEGGGVSRVQGLREDPPPLSLKRPRRQNWVLSPYSGLPGCISRKSYRTSQRHGEGFWEKRVLRNQR